MCAREYSCDVSNQWDSKSWVDFQTRRSERSSFWRVLSCTSVALRECTWLLFRFCACERVFVHLSCRSVCEWCWLVADAPDTDHVTNEKQYVHIRSEVAVFDGAQTFLHSLNRFVKIYQMSKKEIELRTKISFPAKWKVSHTLAFFFLLSFLPRRRYQSLSHIRSLSIYRLQSSALSLSLYLALCVSFSVPLFNPLHLSFCDEMTRSKAVIARCRDKHKSKRQNCNLFIQFGIEGVRVLQHFMVDFDKTAISQRKLFILTIVGVLFWQEALHCILRAIYCMEKLTFLHHGCLPPSSLHQRIRLGGRRATECEGFIYLCITKWALSIVFMPKVDGTRVMEYRTQKPHNKNSPFFAAAAAGAGWALAKSRKWTPIYICQTAFRSLLPTTVQWETDCVIIMVSAQNRIPTHFTYCDHNSSAHTHTSPVSSVCSDFIGNRRHLSQIHVSCVLHLKCNVIAKYYSNLI